MLRTATLLAEGDSTGTRHSWRRAIHGARQLLGQKLKKTFYSSLVSFRLYLYICSGTNY